MIPILINEISHYRKETDNHKGCPYENIGLTAQVRSIQIVGTGLAPVRRGFRGKAPDYVQV